jgi:hypothetical protein
MFILMLAPTFRYSSCWRRTPRRGGIYACRGRTHDGCDARRCSSGWSLWYSSYSTYISLPKCRCGDSGWAATDCRHCRVIKPVPPHNVVEILLDEVAQPPQVGVLPLAVRGDGPLLISWSSAMASGSAGLQRYFNIAKKYLAPESSSAASPMSFRPLSGSAASSTSPSPRSTMPPDDLPCGSAAQSTTW